MMRSFQCNNASDRTRGAVVLCGGGSRRMGRDKAGLPISGETMLGRVVRLLGEVIDCRNMVVVAAADQRLPPLPAGVLTVRDREPDAGPLPALVEGLAALPAGVQAAFVTACDAPLLRPEFVSFVMDELTASAKDAAVPRDGERLHPLAAAYRAAALPKLKAAIAGSKRSLHGALEGGGLRVRELMLDELRRVDPELESLVNCNTVQAYDSMLERLGGTP